MSAKISSRLHLYNELVHDKLTEVKPKRYENVCVKNRNNLLTVPRVDDKNSVAFFVIPDRVP